MKKSNLKIWLLVLALIVTVILSLFSILWRQLSHKGLRVAKAHFQKVSFETEDQILNQYGVYVASDAVYLETFELCHDSQWGWMRCFPIVNIEIRIYLPVAEIDAIQKGGVINLETTKKYQQLRTDIIRTFGQSFKDKIREDLIMYDIKLLPVPEDLNLLKKKRETFRQRLKQLSALPSSSL